MGIDLTDHRNVSGSDTERTILEKIKTLQKRIESLRSKRDDSWKTIPQVVAEHDLEVAQNQLRLVRLKHSRKKSGTKARTS